MLLSFFFLFEELQNGKQGEKENPEIIWSNFYPESCLF